MAQSTFQGFPKEGLSFLHALKANNNRDWFEEHRTQYQNYLLCPARAFVEDMGELLRIIAPDVIADPRVNRSIFRLNRDTRFHKNRDPYKTQLALWFWEGLGKRMECSGFYVQIDPDEVFIATGTYQFLPDQLRDWRAAMGDEAQGRALQTVLDTIPDTYSISGQMLKRTPRGFAKDHPNAALLKHKGLIASITVPRAEVEELHTDTFVPWCMNHFQAIEPLHAWLRDFTRDSFMKNSP